jgi:hypothetical protein
VIGFNVSSAIASELAEQLAFRLSHYGFSLQKSDSQLFGDDPHATGRWMLVDLAVTVAASRNPANWSRASCDGAEPRAKRPAHANETDRLAMGTN